MPTWIVATRSRGKLAELIPMLGERGITGVGLDEAGIAALADEDSIEVFETFEANALAKARYFAHLTGRPCLADDSGLCVDALNGAPGVRSRRFASDCGVQPGSGDDADEVNNGALLEACRSSGHAPPWSAHFACAMALVDAHREVVALGRSDGVILAERRGTHGFGYDPYFLSGDLGVTFADASREEKARVSHRARAINALLAVVAAQSDGPGAC